MVKKKKRQDKLSFSREWKLKIERQIGNNEKRKERGGKKENKYASNDRMAETGEEEREDQNPISTEERLSTFIKNSPIPTSLHDGVLLRLLLCLLAPCRPPTMSQPTHRSAQLSAVMVSRISPTPLWSYHPWWPSRKAGTIFFFFPSPLANQQERKKGTETASYLLGSAKCRRYSRGSVWCQVGLWSTNTIQACGRQGKLAGDRVCLLFPCAARMNEIL